MSLLNELDQYSKIENPIEGDYWKLYEFSYQLSETLQKQRMAGSRLNKKNRRIKSRLDTCEEMLFEKGIDTDMITRRMQG